jgi:hypothetical protein
MRYLNATYKILPSFIGQNYTDFIAQKLSFVSSVGNRLMHKYCVVGLEGLGQLIN